MTTTAASGKSAIAYAHIKNMIINNELKCGEIVSENKLAKQLDMSRTPVREAIQSLYNEGYVEIHKGVGILIKYVTLKEVYDVNSVRLLMECFAIRNSLNNYSQHQLKQLLDRWVALHNCILQGGGDYQDDLFELDDQTHAFIIDYSGNEILKQVMDTLRERIRRYQKIFTRVTNDDANTVDQHIQILRSIQDKDAEQACTLLEKHIFNPLNVMFENQQEYLY